MHIPTGPPFSPNTFPLRVGSRCDHHANGAGIPGQPPGDTQFRHAPRRGSGQKFYFRDSETAHYYFCFKKLNPPYGRY